MRSYFKMWIKAEGAERFACEAATSPGYWVEPDEQSAASCPLAVLDSWLPPPQHTGNQQWLGNPWALPRQREGPMTLGQLVGLFLSTGNPHSCGSAKPSSWQFSLSSPITVDKSLSWSPGHQPSFCNPESRKLLKYKSQEREREITFQLPIQLSLLWFIHDPSWMKPTLRHHTQARQQDTAPSESIQSYSYLYHHTGLSLLC